MYVAGTIALLVCATSVLTLSVTETKTAAGSPSETHVDHAENFHDPGGLRQVSKPVVKSETNLSNDNTHATPTTKADEPSHEVEMKNASKIAPKSTVVAEGIKLTSEDLLPADPKMKLPKIRTASVVARKGAIPPPKISPRKGVGPETSMPTVSTAEGFNEAGHSASSSSDPPKKKIVQTSAKAVEKNSTTTAKTEQKLDAEHVGVVASIGKDNSTVRENSTSPSTPIDVGSTTESKISEVTSPRPTPKRFKPKPTVTIGEMDIDKPIPASPTKTPPLGMPRKIDYIVPVIITIMALPLLGGAAFFLYRRGRDCWDKRHYRRMDFLIDGMYNDYSWK